MPLGRRSVLALAAVSVVGVFAFGWPFLADPTSFTVDHAADAPWLFALLLPLVLGVVLATLADGGLDAKGIAVLAVLSAVVAAVRPLSAGVAGLELVWIVVVLGGRALGPGFGFALGSVSMFASALITGGVGPWLPFQMLGAAWVGLGAGLLPPVRGRREVVMCAAYGAGAAVLYGWLLNLWFWPFLSGIASQVSFVPGDPVLANLRRWIVFDLTTSLGYDLPRGVLTAALILVAGGPVLLALRRAARRACFDADVRFRPAVPAGDALPDTGRNPVGGETPRKETPADETPRRETPADALPDSGRPG
ncbi:MAG: ECF transporter S component [Actinomycetota bacterium]|nr:MAG: ECF transporter S component [Actinomycetota bacterium]